MTDNFRTLPAGDTLFEEFVEQVKQVLEHLYDFAYLQQHPLARIYDRDSDLSAKTAGHQLRYELMTIIESFKPLSEAHFRAPDARLYNLLHLYYVEKLTIQETGAELGLSERQAYRDLRRSQESVAAVVWDHRLPPESPPQDFSFDSEVARLKLNFSPVDVGAIFQQAQHAVERLAEQQSIEVIVEADAEPITLSTDPALAHQVIVGVLSSAIQQASAGVLSATAKAQPGAMAITLRYQAKADTDPTTITDSGAAKLAQRLQWDVTAEDLPDGLRQVTLRLTSRSVTILVIDDNEGWIELLGRFLEGTGCLIVPLPSGDHALQRVQELRPSVIILDVMMPEQDGWELLQRLRTHPTTHTLPVIVCTVFDDPQLAFSLGASAFISKPANRDQILNALKQLNIV